MMNGLFVFELQTQTATGYTVASPGACDLPITTNDLYNLVAVMSVARIQIHIDNIGIRL